MIENIPTEEQQDDELGRHTHDNAVAYEQHLESHPSIFTERFGQYVLLKDATVISFHATIEDAEAEGKRLYRKKDIFTIEQVK